MVSKKKSIIITGASSGLGKSMALLYARNSDCLLFLFGRSSERLEKVAKECELLGAKVYTYLIDVEEKDKLAEVIHLIDANHGIDIIVACAGVSAGTLDGPETHRQIEKIFSTNLNGTINTIMPVLKSMIARRSGNIIIISSMAGLLGLSSSPSYSASKGAIKLFGEALAAYLHKHNVKVTIALPGFIKTPMTDVNNFPMPFMTTPEKAAKKIILAASKGKLIIAFPLIIYIFLKIINILPTPIISFFNSKIPGKPKFDFEENK